MAGWAGVPSLSGARALLEVAERGSGGAAVGLGLREALDKRDEAEDCGHRAGQVELRVGRAALVVQQCDGADSGRDRDGDVDVHASTPGEVLGEPPPSSRPIAPPAPPMAPKTPNALSRSSGAVKVGVSRERAEGASSVPKRP